MDEDGAALRLGVSGLSSMVPRGNRQEPTILISWLGIETD